MRIGGRDGAGVTGGGDGMHGAVGLARIGAAAPPCTPAPGVATATSGRARRAHDATSAASTAGSPPRGRAPAATSSSGRAGASWPARAAPGRPSRPGRPRSPCPSPRALIRTMSANANEPATTTTISAAEVTIRPLRSRPARHRLAGCRRSGPTPPSSASAGTPRSPSTARRGRRTGSPAGWSRRTRAAGSRAGPTGCRPGRSRRAPRSWRTIDRVFITSALAGSTTERRSRNRTR